jgi:hypothetical protein
MSLNVINEGYAAQYAAALATTDTTIARAKGTEKEMLRAARTKLVEFNDMNLASKSAVQRRLKSSQYSGHPLVNDFITAFTVFPSYIEDLRVSVSERAALQSKRQLH